MVLNLKNTIFYWIEELFLKAQKNDGEFNIEVINESNQYRINISGKDVSLLTNNNNEYLLSLQHIIRTLVHLDFPQDRTHFLLDANLTRKSKEEKLKIMLPTIVDDLIINKGNSVIITGLNGYERLLVRRCVDEIKDIDIKSVGGKNDRKLIILPSSEIGTKRLDDSVVFDTTLMKVI